MNILHNNYKKLRQNNIDESVNLKGSNRRMIEQMVDYISSGKISLFDIEIVKRDLIGIGQEAEMEGISLEEKLGVPEKEFADSLATEIKGKSGSEWILLLSQRVFASAFILYIISFLFLGCPKDYGIGWDILFFVTVLVIVDQLIEIKIRQKFLYNRKKKVINFIFSLLSIFLYVVWIFIPGYGSLAVEDWGLWIEIPQKTFYLIQGNGWLIAMLLLALWIISMLINNYYWNKQSEKYDWES